MPFYIDTTAGRDDSEMPELPELKDDPEEQEIIEKYENKQIRKSRMFTREEAPALFSVVHQQTNRSVNNILQGGGRKFSLQSFSASPQVTPTDY